MIPDDDDYIPDDAFVHDLEDEDLAEAAYQENDDYMLDDAFIDDVEDEDLEEAAYQEYIEWLEREEGRDEMAYEAWCEEKALEYAEEINTGTKESEAEAVRNREETHHHRDLLDQQENRRS